MFRNVHCALLFAHLYIIAVVTDGAEENNLCAVHIVHLCVVLMMEMESCNCALLSGYLLHGSSHGTRYHAAHVMEKKCMFESAMRF